ncbi:hypothetical protein BH11ARM2_BH11ARM2_22470 [soil metagenome]
MRLSRPRSVRAKLTLTTVGVITATLLFLSFITDVASRKTLLVSIDRDLQARGDDLAQFGARDDHGPHGPRGGPDGPPPDDGEPHGFGRPDDRGGRRPPPPRKRDPVLTPPAGFRFDGKEAPFFPGPHQEKPYDTSALAQAKNGQASFSFVDLSQGTTRVYTVPVFQNGKVVGAVQTAYPMEDVFRASDNLRFILLTVVMPIGIALASLASLFVVGRLLSPLRRLLGDAERIDTAGGGGRLAVVGQDEFAELASTLNGMLGRLDVSFQAQQAALEAQRRFSADASHELKTPLAVVKANAGLLLYASSLSGEDRESLVAIDDAAGRMNRLVRDLLLLARADDGGIKAPSGPCDLGEIAARALRETPNGLKRAILRVDRPANVVCVPDDLSRVLVNLIDNAIKHSGTQELVMVSVEGSTISIADRGEGIPPEHIAHLFDRFYRVEESRSSESGGTGLGLAIVKSIVNAHGGEVEVQSKVGEGTTFVVRLAPASP